MGVTDLLILPIGCLVCGLLASSSMLLRNTPVLRAAIDRLTPFRVPIGMATALAGLIALLLPAHGPPFIGSLLPAVVGIAIGLSLSLDVLLDVPMLRRRWRALAILGAALTYARRPLGLLAVLSGLLHLLYPGAPLV